MSRARTFADLATASEGNNISIPNMIINGDCRVAQRGTSLASITSGNNFQVDRWLFQPSGHGTWTLSQNSSTGLTGFETSVKALCTSNGGTPAGGDFVQFLYNIEGYDTQRLKFGQSDAESFTISWYVKSNKTGTGIVEAQTTESTASATVETTKTYTISQANTWEFKSVTFPANTAHAQATANKTTSSGLGIRWIIDSGTNQTSGTAPTTWANQTTANRWAGHTLNIGRADDDYMEITGVQLDIGDVAQPFKYESYAENLARCQRYFVMDKADTAYKRYLQGVCTTATWTECLYYYPVTMRAQPSLGSSGTTGHYLIEVNSGASAAPSEDPSRSSHSDTTNCIVNLRVSGTTLTTGDNCQITSYNTTSGYLSYDAEL